MMIQKKNQKKTRDYGYHVKSNDINIHYGKDFIMYILLIIVYLNFARDLHLI